MDGELLVVDGDYEQKREKQSEVQVDMPRSSSSSRGAFSKNVFRDKGRTHDLDFFQNYLKTATNQRKPST